MPNVDNSLRILMMEIFNRIMFNVLSIPQNEVESIRLRTTDYEMVIAQHGNFTIIVIQDRDPSVSKADPKGSSAEEKKENESDKKETA